MSTLIAFLTVLWLGFLVHRSPRFSGSLDGGVLAVTAATLMVVPSIAYMTVKRVSGLRRRMSARGSVGDLLTWHVYTSAVGAILALLHTGHRFESDLGIALVTAMLITTLSGYVGRHLLARVAQELREKQDQLRRLETAYNEIVGKLAQVPEALLTKAASRSMFSLWWVRSAIVAMLLAQGERDLPYRALRIAESIAELEQSISTHEHSKRLAGHWLKLHIAASLAFYVLLALHIWASIHFGLRWFD